MDESARGGSPLRFDAGIGIVFVLHIFPATQTAGKLRLSLVSGKLKLGSFFIFLLSSLGVRRLSAEGHFGAKSYVSLCCTCS